MSIFVFRVLAMLTMLADHTAYFFLSGCPALRTVCRFAFIAYAFMLAEGYLQIRNDAQRVRKHLLRLFVLTVLGELAYDLAFSRSVNPADQSVMLPLLLGYVGMVLGDQLKTRKNGLFFTALLYLLFAFLTYFANTNYRFAGVLLIFAFFWYLQRRDRWSVGKRLLILFAVLALYIPIYNWARFDFCDLASLCLKAAPYRSWNLATLFMALPLAFYNGKLGYHARWFKTLYVWFYPVHLLLIAMVVSLR